MISVTVFVDSEHQYESIRMLGHAGLADDHQEGQELVCAAVSALVLNMANSILPMTRLRQIRTRKQEVLTPDSPTISVLNQDFL